ncbi:MAG: periplasmic heavy metal sensor [Tabrizicola sp.]|jgi:uncharacterized membrane protein|nr:periplasmic heavy metal sensor [Tabrizicola sp.]
MTWGRVLLWVVLGASLLANAVMLGLVLRFGGMGGLAGFGEGAMGERSVWAEVPPETRAAFREGIAENRRELLRLVRELRAARAEMLAAAAARPYDRNAVIAAQEKARAATAELQLKTQALMLRALDRAAGVGAADNGSP